MCRWGESVGVGDCNTLCRRAGTASIAVPRVLQILVLSFVFPII